MAINQGRQFTLKNKLLKKYFHKSNTLLLIDIITGMHKESILIWNIKLNTYGGIYVYTLG
jgi:hypothetical protein